MKNFSKIWYLSAAAFVLVVASTDASAQDRPRVVTGVSSRPTNQPVAPTSKPVTTAADSRPTNIRRPLTQDIQVQRPVQQQSLVTKTVSSASTGFGSVIASRSIYSGSTTSSMQKAIFSRLGIPYLYGSSGPNRYDCSGFVWAVFRDAGMDFERQSARSLWSASVPVEGDERYRFGTLVFLNGLGHMGIVADENGFYHASSSKGITYSRFDGYWEKRIVGFRRLVMGTTPQISDK